MQVVLVTGVVYGFPPLIGAFACRLKNSLRITRLIDRVRAGTYPAAKAIDPPVQQAQQQRELGFAKDCFDGFTQDAWGALDADVAAMFDRSEFDARA